MQIPFKTNFKTLALVFLVGFTGALIGACTRPYPNPVNIPTSNTVLSPTSAVSLPIVPVAPLPVPTGLIVNEVALQGAPSTEPFGFTPVEGTMEEILARNETLRAESFPDNSSVTQQFTSMRRVLVGEKELVAREEFSQNGSEGWVSVLDGEQEIYRIATGPSSPVTPFRGFWSYADHWVLETALISLNEANDPAVKFKTGQIIQDGVLLNDLFGYTEMFGFQTLGGKLFFFFEKDGLLGYAYDGQVVEAGYTAIPHYECCSAGVLNPHSAQNLVAFFAQREGIWYYVEIGVAGGE